MMHSSPMTRAVSCALVALLAYFAFDEIPDHWTWIGAAVIVGSAIYIARRETRLAIDGAAGRTPQAQT